MVYTQKSGCNSFIFDDIHPAFIFIAIGIVASEIYMHAICLKAIMSSLFDMIDCAYNITLMYSSRLAPPCIPPCLKPSQTGQLR